MRHTLVLTLFVGLAGQACAAEGKVVTKEITFASGKAKTSRRTPGGYEVTGLELKLNDLGAVTLNSQLRTDQFAIGEVFAVAAITAKR